MNEMKRREFMKTMGWGAAALLAPGLLRPARAAAAAKRPNVLFLCPRKRPRNGGRR